MTQEERDRRVQEDRQLKQQRQQMLRQQHAQQATGGTAGQPLSRSGGGGNSSSNPHVYVHNPLGTGQTSGSGDPSVYVHQRPANFQPPPPSAHHQYNSVVVEETQTRRMIANPAAGFQHEQHISHQQFSAQGQHYQQVQNSLQMAVPASGGGYAMQFPLNSNQGATGHPSPTANQQYELSDAQREAMQRHQRFSSIQNAQDAQFQQQHRWSHGRGNQ